MDTGYPINNNAAYIIKRINEILGKKPGKKALQKLIFLIEQKGINLNFEYELHFYGPYSETLDNATRFLGADGIIQFDYSGYSHRMGINEQFNILPDNLSAEQTNEIDNIIARFKDKTPSELELLTTAIYAYNHLENKTKESVVNGVIKIKGSKYPTDRIEESLNDFDYFDKKFTV
jgi:uncharacterized protein YwgA